MLKRSNKSKRKRLMYIVLILLVVIAIIAGVVWKLASKPSINPTNANTASQNTKGEVNSSSSGQSGSSTSNSASGGSSQSKSGSNTASSGAILETPTGNFVSDHHPNLSGHPAPNQMASSCTTTPGASCKITFTDNGVTESLGSEKTDAGGSAYWSWTLQSIGLTQGTWSIQAIATLNGSTKTASDAQNLVVAQ